MSRLNGLRIAPTFLMIRLLMLQLILAFGILGLSHSETTTYSYELKNKCYSKDALNALSYEKIIELIKSKNLRTIEELLPELPECFRSSYTLVHESLSLQAASPLYPRTILFSHDGKLSCTFNGHPSQKGFDSLECYQYRDKTRKFEFYEIEFPSPRNQLKEVEFSLPNMNVRKTISCTACHNQDPRPNWEPYSVWPGVYGKHSDQLKSVANAQMIPAANLAEGKNFLAFKQTMKSSSRYRFLINPIETDFAPYQGDGRFFREAGLLLSPNTRFTVLLSPLVAQRNVRLLENQPRWVAYQYLRTVARCQVSEDEKKQYPEFIYSPTPDHSRLAYDRVLKTVADAFKWAPSFRPLLANCEECDESGSYLTEHLFSYNDGLGDFNKSIASLLIEYLIETGESDLKPVYSLINIKRYGNTYDYIDRDNLLSNLRAIDTDQLKQGCDLLYDKFKKTYKK